jgi:periplasmic divalent cation tolerance protein
MSPSEHAAADATDLRIVLTTAPDAACGERIARALVDERLAACVNVVPGMRSIYRWEGAVQEEAEVLLVAKTRADRVAELEARVRALHPYEVPEVIALPVEAGSAAYVRWVREESAR